MEDAAALDAEAPDAEASTDAESPPKAAEKARKEPKERHALGPYGILREWSYSEATFDELKSRGDLDPDRPEQIMQVADMLKPQDVKKHVGTVF